MKAFQKTICILLTLVLTVSLFSVCASADVFTESDFIRYYSNGKNKSEGAAYYEVDNAKGTLTFYPSSDGSDNLIKSGSMEYTGYRLYGVWDNPYISDIIFLGSYQISARTLKNVPNLKTIRFYNGAGIISEETGNFGNCGDHAGIVVYGTTEANVLFAQAHSFQYRDLNGYTLAVPDGSAARIDEDAHRITGLAPQTTPKAFASAAVNGLGCDPVVEKDGFVGTGDSMDVVKWIDGSVADSYTLLLFGDADGDGIYDARDAFLVNLMANGLLTREQVGDVVWSAADCNHDGEVDALDVAILEQAGLLLSQVDQSAPVEEQMQTDAYAEYLSLIDQSAPQAEEAPAQQTGFAAWLLSLLQTLVLFIQSLWK